MHASLSSPRARSLPCSSVPLANGAPDWLPPRGYWWRLLGGGRRYLDAPSPSSSHRCSLQVLHSTFVAMVSVS